MKPGDYKTSHQAKHYHYKRFSGGLAQVNSDENILLKSWIPKIPKSLIYLDLGSGTGRVTKILLTQNSKKIYALDQSKAMINFLREKFPKQIKNKKLKLIIADCQKIPLSSESADFVTAFHLFKHLPNPGLTLEETARVLNHGGYFIFNFLNIHSLIHFNLDTCYALSKHQMIALLKQYGFRVEKIFYLCVFGETIYNIIDRKQLLLIHSIDKFLCKYFHLGTKIFFLARKL